jgi:hypothetical protein
MKIACLLEQDSNKPILDADKLARYDYLANLVEELHDENMRMRQQLSTTDGLSKFMLCGKNPVAWITTDEEGSPAMLFFDKQEALMFSGDDGPVPLYKEANNRRRQAGALRRSGEPKEQGK